MLVISVNRGKVVVACRDSRRELRWLMVLVMVLGDVDLRPSANVACSLAASTLEECVDLLLLLLTVIAIDTVTTSFVAQVRVVSPLLRASSPCQD